MKDRRPPLIVALLPAAVLAGALLGAWGRHGEPRPTTSPMGGPALNLRGARLAALNLAGADLRYSCLAGADLRHANLRDAQLWVTDLSHADLTAAILLRAQLQEADLRRAILVRANLCGADLRGSHLDDASVQGARYDIRTQWPVSFETARARSDPGPRGRMNASFMGGHARCPAHPRVASRFPLPQPLRPSACSPLARVRAVSEVSLTIV
jgi:hypothetical protein